MSSGRKERSKKFQKGGCKTVRCVVTYVHQLKQPCEPPGMERPDGEGTLENPIQLGAEGARRASAESLRQKDGADELFACHLLSPESPFSGGSIFMQGEKNHGICIVSHRIQDQRVPQ